MARISRSTCALRFLLFITLRQEQKFRDADKIMSNKISSNMSTRFVATPVVGISRDGATKIVATRRAASARQTQTQTDCVLAASPRAEKRLAAESGHTVTRLWIVAGAGAGTVLPWKAPSAAAQASASHSRNLSRIIPVLRISRTIFKKTFETVQYGPGILQYSQDEILN